MQSVQRGRGGRWYPGTRGTLAWVTSFAGQKTRPEKVNPKETNVDRPHKKKRKQENKR
jgi:hypothetical protein